MEACIGFDRRGDGPESLDKFVLGEMDMPNDIDRRRWRRRGRVGLGHSTLLWVQEPGGAAKGAEAGSHGGAKLRAVGNEPFPFEGFARGCRISACRRGSGHLDNDPVAAAGYFASIARREFAEAAGQSLDRLAPADMAGADTLSGDDAACDPGAELCFLQQDAVPGPGHRPAPRDCRRLRIDYTALWSLRGHRDIIVLPAFKDPAHIPGLP